MITVQLYSVQPIAQRDLVIPGDPYESTEAAVFLRSLGVIFWRDEAHTNPVTMLDDIRCPINGFRSQGVFDEVDDENSDMRVSEWDIDPPRENPDNLSWIQFNKQCVILEISSSGIKAQM